jgi:acyl carrier protein
MLLRDQLIDLIKDSDMELGSELEDDTSLINSGRIDSMALFNLAVWVEGNIDSKLDLTTIDVSKEWDTIADILNFLEKHRNHGGTASEKDE